LNNTAVINDLQYEQLKTYLLDGAGIQGSNVR